MAATLQEVWEATEGEETAGLLERQDQPEVSTQAGAVEANIIFRLDMREVPA